MMRLAMLVTIATGIAAPTEGSIEPDIVILSADHASRPVDLYGRMPNNMFAASGSGPNLSIDSIGGHAPGDSLRTQIYVKSTSKTDASIEETASDFEIASVTGYARPWRASTLFPAGTQIHGGDGGIFKNANACNSSTKAPSGTEKEKVDGTCRWAYVGIGGGDGKSAILATANVYAGGGQAWGQALIMGVQGGAWPEGGGFGVGQEIDVGNSTHDCPPGTQYGCNIFGSFINGNGLFESTIGLFIGGTRGFHYGIHMPKGAASEIAFNEGTDAATGILESGSKTIASYRDQASSPRAISLEGKYDDGIQLVGNFRNRQIFGAGWLVSPGGDIIARSFAAGLQTPTSSQMACEAGHFVDDERYHYVCVAHNKWRRVALEDF